MKQISKPKTLKVSQAIIVTSYAVTTEIFGLIGHIIYTPDCGYIYQPMGSIHDERLELGGVEVSYDTLESIQTVLDDYYSTMENDFENSQKDQDQVDRFAVNPH